jgi:hypothetical protein
MRQVDDQLEFGRLLDRNIAGLHPAQNSVDKIGGAPELFRDIRPVGHQTSRFDEFPPTAHRRQLHTLCQGRDLIPIRN